MKYVGPNPVYYFLNVLKDIVDNIEEGFCVVLQKDEELLDGLEETELLIVHNAINVHLQRCVEEAFYQGGHNALSKVNNLGLLVSVATFEGGCDDAQDVGFLIPQEEIPHKVHEDGPTARLRGRHLGAHWGLHYWLPEIVLDIVALEGAPLLNKLSVELEKDKLGLGVIPTEEFDSETEVVHVELR